MNAFEEMKEYLLSNEDNTSLYYLNIGNEVTFDGSALIFYKMNNVNEHVEVLEAIYDDNLKHFITEEVIVDYGIVHRDSRMSEELLELI